MKIKKPKISFRCGCVVERKKYRFTGNPGECSQLIDVKLSSTLVGRSDEETDRIVKIVQENHKFVAQGV